VAVGTSFGHSGGSVVVVVVLVVVVVFVVFVVVACFGEALGVVELLLHPAVSTPMAHSPKSNQTPDACRLTLTRYSLSRCSRDRASGGPRSRASGPVGPDR